MNVLRHRVASLAVMAAALLPRAAQAQDLDKLPNYVPVLPAAVAEVTKQPITPFVYSHAHLDHIAGAAFLIAIDTLTGVNGYGSSHCRAALIHARWDD